MKKKAHIIAFDIPFPANYGGVIDVFYRFKALCEEGMDITLHCFEYGDRTRQAELEKYCSKVYYYPRKKLVYQFWLPYIVSSRSSKELLNNLILDDSPILFEALHSCYLLNHPALLGRQKIVRMHNIEHDYYALLAISEQNFFKRSYYQFEAWLLERYENVLDRANIILAISEKDRRQMAERFGEKVLLMPAFHGNNKVSCIAGKSDYCFYHGKLSVAENHQAAMFLVKEVFSKTKTKLFIAGDGYSASLEHAIQKQKNVSLLKNLSPLEIENHIKNAHVNVLTTFQPTGIKLKLVNVLYNGRFIVVNTPMVIESGLEDACHIKDFPADMAKEIEACMAQTFTEEDILKRNKVLGAQFDVIANARKIIALFR